MAVDIGHDECITLVILVTFPLDLVQWKAPPDIIVHSPVLVGQPPFHTSQSH